MIHFTIFLACLMLPLGGSCPVSCIEEDDTTKMTSCPTEDRTKPYIYDENTRTCYKNRWVGCVPLKAVTKEECLEGCSACLSGKQRRCHPKCFLLYTRIQYCLKNHTDYIYDFNTNSCHNNGYRACGKDKGFPTVDECDKACYDCIIRNPEVIKKFRIDVWSQNS